MQKRTIHRLVGRVGRAGARGWALAFLAWIHPCPTASGDPGTDAHPPTPTILVVVGAPGEETFGAQFQAWAAAWSNHCQTAQAKSAFIGLEKTSVPSDQDQLRTFLEAETKDSPAPFWLVLLGHGTYDGHSAKFNLRGPDLSATDLKLWLEPFRRPLAIINTASSSGPFLNALSATGRVVITATKSGFEQNFARLGQYLATTIGDPDADLDKDGQTSLLEAYLTASRQVAQFYEAEGRLATEHALLDDNGDGLGTPPDWFQGVRAVKKAQDSASPDGWRAHQFHLIPSRREQHMPAEMRARRDALELAIAQLRERKAGMEEGQYYTELETLMLDLGRLYRQAEAAP